MLAELQQQGLIRHLGVSTVSAEQIAKAQSIAPVACVQNFYNLANRADDDLIDDLASQSIAYVPYFPLGGFSPLQAGALDVVAVRHGAKPMGVTLSWLLQRSPNILLIPGTSSVAHLRENVEGAAIELGRGSARTRRNRRLSTAVYRSLPAYEKLKLLFASGKSGTMVSASATESAGQLRNDGSTILQTRDRAEAVDFDAMHDAATPTLDDADPRAAATRDACAATSSAEACIASSSIKANEVRTSPTRTRKRA